MNKYFNYRNVSYVNFTLLRAASLNVLKHLITDIHDGRPGISRARQLPINREIMHI